MRSSDLGTSQLLASMSWNHAGLHVGVTHRQWPHLCSISCWPHRSQAPPLSLGAGVATEPLAPAVGGCAKPGGGASSANGSWARGCVAAAGAPAGAPWCPASPEGRRKASKVSPSWRAPAAPALHGRSRATGCPAGRAMAAQGKDSEGRRGGEGEGIGSKA
mmetsp:Transcript_6263/g.17078  ORF Transcript_6263/g.17078 Transcript_6263/m.17078 type:complete len:161 (+) Transcript_6263:500-982(+)